MAILSKKQKEQLDQTRKFERECIRRLTRFYRAQETLSDQKSTDESEIKGFMQAGVFLNITSTEDLGKLIEKVRQDVFGEGRDQRRKRSRPDDLTKEIDFSIYERPTWERKREKEK